MATAWRFTKSKSEVLRVSNEEREPSARLGQWSGPATVLQPGELGDTQRVRGWTDRGTDMATCFLRVSAVPGP